MGKCRSRIITIAAIFTFLGVSATLAGTPAIECEEKVSQIFVAGLANEESTAVVRVREKYRAMQETVSSAILQNDTMTASSSLLMIKARVQGDSRPPFQEIPTEDGDVIIENVDAAHACVEAM